MAQVSWRTDDALVARVRAQALHFGLSIDEYLTRLARAATDPTYLEDPAEQVRERLRQAGLFADVPLPEGVPPSAAEIAAAQQRSASGISLADLVDEGRGPR